jgi:hypothetical protein
VKSSKKGTKERNEKMFICQLPREKQLKAYKAIKACLIYEDAYTIENLQEAMSNQVSNLPYKIQEAIER